MLQPDKKTAIVLVLENNAFVERVLPSAVLSTLSETDMNAYRAPYLEPGESGVPR